MIGVASSILWPAIYRVRGGRPAPYIASAVHFDGLTSLLNSALVAANSGDLLLNLWTLNAAATFGSPIFIWNYDGADNNPVDFAANSLGMNLTLANFDFSIHTEVGDMLWDRTIWTNVLIAAKTDLPAGQKVFAVYFNDVKQVKTPFDPGGAFTMSLNGVPSEIGDDGFDDHMIGDMADLSMRTVNVLSGTDIPTATRRLFIDASGKPVDPTIARAALGTAIIDLSGDKDAFPINQGTGGVFTLTGTLTNATTSPSD